MIAAEVLVDLVLDAEAPQLLAFGPKLPKEGYGVTARTNNELFTKLIASADLGMAFDPERHDLARTVNGLLKAGYSFVLRPVEGGVYAYSATGEGINSEQLRYFGLTPDSQVRFGNAFPSPTRNVPVSQLLQGEPAAASAKAEILSFRGYENPPGGKYVRADPNTAAFQKGVAAGLAYVIRHPGSREVIFVTPAKFKFTPKELGAIREKFGLTGASKVTWYPDASNVPQTVRIADQWPMRRKVRPQPPTGLATAPPKGLT